MRPDPAELRAAHLGHAVPGVSRAKSTAGWPTAPTATTVETEVLAEQRENLLGGRFVSAMTGSAPISSETARPGSRRLLDIHLIEGYGSTEAGVVFVDGTMRRPPVIDYKLVDVPELGYFRTDQPASRAASCWSSPSSMFPGYYKRPEVTADVFDADGYYRTGDIMAELGPDQLAYVDRRNNVLKLSQGEFVTVSKLEAAFGDSPLIRQIYVYGNSARSVPAGRRRADRGRAGRVGDDVAALKPLHQRVAAGASRAAAGLQSYEIPRDFIIETTPFTLENGLLTGIRKLARPQAQGALRRAARAAVRRPGRRPGRRAARAARRTAPTGRCWRPSAGPPARCWVRPPTDLRPTRSSPISVETRCPR